MTLQEQLMEEMKNAMRAHEVERLGMIRMIRSEVKNYEIDNGPADDNAVQKIIKRMLNQQQDALNDFKSAGREDLISETEAKIAILETYLPKQLSEAELLDIVKEVVEASPVKDFGPLMGQVMKKVGTQADGGRVSSALKQVLA